MTQIKQSVAYNLIVRRRIIETMSKFEEAQWAICGGMCAGLHASLNLAYGARWRSRYAVQNFRTNWVAG